MTQTETFHKNPYFIELPPTELKDRFTAIRDLKDPNEQFKALNPGAPYGASVHLPVHMTDNYVDELISFAADPTSSPSLLVRLQALEQVFDLLLTQRSCDDQAELTGRSGAIMSLLPGADFEEIAYAAKKSYYLTYGAEDFDQAPYRRVINDLADQEGIDLDLIYPDWHQFSDDPLGDMQRDYNPVFALLMLQRLAAIQSFPHKLPVSSLAALVPLALDAEEKFNGNFVDITEAHKNKLRQDALCIQELSDLPEALPYIERLGSLKAAALELKNIFPSSYGMQVEESAQDLIAKCVYAIQAHLMNGSRSHIRLPLNGNFDHGLPLNLRGDEPLGIISALHDVISQLCAQVTDRSSVVTAVTDEPDYQVYRLWNKDLANNTSVYIRPYGAKGHDPYLEYGNGNGVEASISYVIDPGLSSNGLLRLGRYRKTGPDNRVSIRLDREGVAPSDRNLPGVLRDPTQPQGTLSLDIGSVLGHEKSLGTKIGRFLAWGDLLRAQGSGEQTQLNHVTRHFRHRDGSADFFAESASELRAILEKRKADPAQLLERLAGRLGLAGLNQAE